MFSSSFGRRPLIFSWIVHHVSPLAREREKKNKRKGGMIIDLDRNGSATEVVFVCGLGLIDSKYKRPPARFLDGLCHRKGGSTTYLFFGYLFPKVFFSLRCLPWAHTHIWYAPASMKA